MTPATAPREPRDTRLLVIGAVPTDHRLDDLPLLLGPGDVLVVNDAFTLPASIRGRIGDVAVELRLAEPPDGLGRAWAVLFGPGSWRDPTERRSPPPSVEEGDHIAIPGGAVEIVDVHPEHDRLVRVRIAARSVWSQGRPIQYSYLERDLELSEVQTPYAGPPWAVEMPSAGRALTVALQRRLRVRGVRIVALTHAAGLSSTGDPALDEALPLPERYAVPEATWDAVLRAERVVAVGTSVVRALESAARGARDGVTALRLGPGTPLRVVDGLLSGMHEPGESHFALMEAFAPRGRLLAANRHAVERGYRNHEFGDSTLLWRGGVAEVDRPAPRLVVHAS